MDLTERSCKEPAAVVARRSIAIVQRAVRTGAETISAASIGQSLDVSDRTVQRSVRTVFGKSLREIVIEQRVQRALLLVQTTSLPLAEIALAVGFKSQSRMNEAFRRGLRARPGSFRKTSPDGRTRSGKPAPKKA